MHHPKCERQTPPPNPHEPNLPRPYAAGESHQASYDTPAPQANDKPSSGDPYWRYHAGRVNDNQEQEGMQGTARGAHSHRDQSRSGSPLQVFYEDHAAHYQESTKLAHPSSYEPPDETSNQELHMLVRSAKRPRLNHPYLRSDRGNIDHAPSPREESLIRGFKSNALSIARKVDSRTAQPPPAVPLTSMPHARPSTKSTDDSSPSKHCSLSKRKAPITGIQTPKISKGLIEPKGSTPSAHPTNNSQRSNSSSKWLREEDDRLRDAVAKYGGKNWKLIAEAIGNGRTDVQCLHRWNKVLKPGLVKGPWTPEEDSILLDLVSRHGVGKIRWCDIALHLPGRIGKQCRERWCNHLDSSVRKGQWTPEEDDIVFRLQQKLGNKWSEIAKMLPGRTENAVKNRFNSAARRKWLMSQSTGTQQRTSGSSSSKPQHSISNPGPGTPEYSPQSRPPGSFCGLTNGQSGDNPMSTNPTMKTLPLYYPPASPMERSTHSLGFHNSTNQSIVNDFRHQTHPVIPTANGGSVMFPHLRDLGASMNGATSPQPSPPFYTRAPMGGSFPLSTTRESPSSQMGYSSMNTGMPLRPNAAHRTPAFYLAHSSSAISTEVETGFSGREDPFLMPGAPEARTSISSLQNPAYDPHHLERDAVPIRTNSINSATTTASSTEAGIDDHMSRFLDSVNIELDELSSEGAKLQAQHEPWK